MTGAMSAVMITIAVQRDFLACPCRLFCCCVPVRAAGDNDCAMPAVVMKIVGLLRRLKNAGCWRPVLMQKSTCGCTLGMFALVWKYGTPSLYLQFYTEACVR